jgi:hypothetical protein
LYQLIFSIHNFFLYNFNRVQNLKLVDYKICIKFAKSFTIYLEKYRYYKYEIFNEIIKIDGIFLFCSFPVVPKPGLIDN